MAIYTHIHIQITASHTHTLYLPADYVDYIQRGLWLLFSRCPWWQFCVSVFVYAFSGSDRRRQLGQGRGKRSACGVPQHVALSRVRQTLRLKFSSQLVALNFVGRTRFQLCSIKKYLTNTHTGICIYICMVYTHTLPYTYTYTFCRGSIKPKSSLIT